MFRIINSQDRKYSIQSCSDLIQAASDGDVVGVKQLLAEGAYPDSRDSENHTALLLAAAGNYCNVTYELLCHGSDVDAVNQSGLTALMVACACGYNDLVSLLLFYGANPNRANCDGRTPLMFASSSGYPGIVEMLLDVQPKIDVSMTDSSGKSALDIAIALGNDDVARLLAAEWALQSNVKSTARRRSGVVVRCI
jgi:ankyrin repeat protein